MHVALMESLCPDAPQNLTISISGAGDPGRRGVPLGLGGDRCLPAGSRAPSSYPREAPSGRTLSSSFHHVQLEGGSQRKRPDAAHPGR